MTHKRNYLWIYRQPVASRLKLANLVTSGAVIFLAGILLLAIQVYLSAVELLEQTRTEAAMTGENLSAAMVFNDKKSGAEILGSLRAFAEISNATVYDAQDQVFAVYDRQEIMMRPVNSQPRKNFYQFTATQLLLGQSFDFKGKHLGTIYLDADLASAYQRLAWYAGLVMLAMVISLAIGHAVLVWLQRFVTAPLLALAQTSELIATKGDFSIRAAVDACADIGLLATAFNTMLDRIEKRESDLESEIFERKRVEIKLDRLAHFDNITGLHNRYFFNDRLSSVVTRAQSINERAIVMFLDLDNFKAINDTLGHDTGDELLSASRMFDGLMFTIADGQSGAFR